MLDCSALTGMKVSGCLPLARQSVDRTQGGRQTGMDRGTDVVKNSVHVESRCGNQAVHCHVPPASPYETSHDTRRDEARGAVQLTQPSSPNQNRKHNEPSNSNLKKARTGY